MKIEIKENENYKIRICGEIKDIKIIKIYFDKEIITGSPKTPYTKKIEISLKEKDGSSRKTIFPFSYIEELVNYQYNKIRKSLSRI